MPPLWRRVRNKGEESPPAALKGRRLRRGNLAFRYLSVTERFRQGKKRKSPSTATGRIRRGKERKRGRIKSLTRGVGRGGEERAPEKEKADLCQHLPSLSTNTNFGEKNIMLH